MIKKIIILLVTISVVYSQTDTFFISETGHAIIAEPQIIIDSTGGAMVVWDEWRHHYEANFDPLVGSCIFAQMLDLQGNLLGINFEPVSKPAYLNDRLPSIDMNENGNIALTWQREDLSNEDSKRVICLQLFNPHMSSPIMDVFPVNNLGEEYSQNFPKVKYINENTLVVLWLENRDSRLCYYARYFNKSGQPLAGAFRVNTNDTHWSYVKLDIIGNFAFFTWKQYYQIYSEQGKPLTSIRETGIHDVIALKAVDSTHVLLVSRPEPTYQLYGHLYNIWNQKIVKTFRIDRGDEHENSKGSVSIATNNENGIIVWTDYRNDYPGIITSGDIYAQRYDSNWEEIGENFKLNHEDREIPQTNSQVVLFNDTIMAVWIEDKKHVAGIIQSFDNPVPGEIWGWKTLWPPDSADTAFQYQLLHNFPNPFYTSHNFTRIRYCLQKEGYVNICIYNTLGEKVRSLVSGIKSVGWHLATWNGTKDNEEPLPSGLYFYKLTTDNFTQSKKLVYIK